MLFGQEFDVFSRTEAEEMDTEGQALQVEYLKNKGNKMRQSIIPVMFCFQGGKSGHC